MRAARFVTVCFVYAGVLLSAQSFITYRQSLNTIAVVAQLGVAGSILAVGLYRLWKPEVEAENPAAYGPFAYGLAALSLLVTVLLLAQFVLL